VCYDYGVSVRHKYLFYDLWVLSLNVLKRIGYFVHSFLLHLLNILNNRVPRIECLLPAIESHELFVLLNLLACYSNYSRGLIEVETKFSKEVVYYAFLFK
jgi:hypothetical protein